MRGLPKLVAALAAICMTVAAYGEAWPTKPVRMIVPFPPGGTTDIMARVLAKDLQTSLRQSFVVDNRGGAGGIIGTEMTAKSMPDGYTIMLSSSAPLAVGLKLYPKVPYDVMRDLAPVSMVGDVPMVLVTHAKFAPQTLRDVIAYAKAHPGKLTVALNALGSQSHLLTELFRLRTGTSINMIPYKGSGPAVVDLLAGAVDSDFENLPAVIQHIQSGRLRAVAVLSEKRLDLLPDTPTFVELDMPEFVATPWFAIVAPAATPRVIVARLNTEINKTLSSAETRAVFAKQGANAVIATPQATGRYFRAEIDKWAKIVAETGAKLQ
ncbi:MAG: tripartite tricarboxylate transporter substrate binding protein [Burkholderiales bacterium]|nr:tripartite tricarboxylate transporter substrate binding protein [Burkholderiales bacterium]